MIFHHGNHDVSSWCDQFSSIFINFHHDFWWSHAKNTWMMFITRGTAPLELNWEAYSSREDFHREKHYDFCSKQVPNSEQNSSNMFWTTAGPVGVHDLPTLPLSTRRPSRQGAALEELVHWQSQVFIFRSTYSHISYNSNNEHIIHIIYNHITDDWCIQY